MEIQQIALTSPVAYAQVRHLVLQLDAADRLRLMEDLFNEFRRDLNVTNKRSIIRSENTAPRHVQNHYLTIEQAAERIGVKPKMVSRWIERGSLKTISTSSGILIPIEALAKHEELNTILGALDADRPPATDEEISAALEPDRRDWTWKGKEA